MSIKVRRENKCSACPLAGEPDICLGQLNLTICRKAADAAASPRAASGPGLVRMAANVAVAAVHHAAHGFPHVSEEVAAARLAICRSCEHYDAAGNRCNICGCNLSLKISWASQACPIGKW